VILILILHQTLYLPSSLFLFACNPIIIIFLTHSFNPYSLSILFCFLYILPIYDDIRLKEGLVAFKYHAIFDLAVLVQVQPSAVGALTTLAAVIKHPVTLFISDRCLHFRQEFVLDADVTIRSTTYNHLFVIFRTTAIKSELNIGYKISG